MKKRVLVCTLIMSLIMSSLGINAKVILRQYTTDADSPLIPIEGDTISLEPVEDLSHEAAKDMVGSFINQYKGNKFNDVISLGDQGVFINRMNDIAVVIDPSEVSSGSKATYHPAGTFEGYIAVRTDPKLSKGDIDFQETLWHETIHAIEDVNGDIGYTDSVDYAERNVEFMSQVINQGLNTLRVAEGDIESQNWINAKEKWDVFKSIHDGSSKFTPDSVKAYPPDYDLLKKWFGFNISPDKILAHYASGAAGEDFKVFAEYITSGIPPLADIYKTSGNNAGRVGPFNGMVIDYIITGVDTQTSEYVDGFTSVQRLSGVTSAGSNITVSGTAYKKPGSTSTYGNDVFVYINGVKLFEALTPNKNTTHTFKVEYTLPADLTGSTSVSIQQDGYYSMGGGHRGLDVVGTYDIPEVKPQGTTISQQGGLTTASSWATNELTDAINSNVVPVEIQGDYQKNITREEFCHMIMKVYVEMGGTYPSNKANPFVDTDDTDFIAANMLGIINGKGGGMAKPNDQLTREEMCVMMYRMLDHFYYVKEADKYWMEAYSDASSVSSWALDSVMFFNSQGIYNGVGESKLDPKGKLTREVSIVLVERMYKIYGF